MTTRLPRTYATFVLCGVTVAALTAAAPATGAAAVEHAADSGTAATGSGSAAGGSAAPGSAADQAAAVDGEAPPRLDVLKRGQGLAPGLLFLTPQGRHETPRGPQIVDDRGRPVWYHLIPQGFVAADFQVQEYRGEKVLTWWEGESSPTGTGSGTGYIADENYDVIATVTTPDAGERTDFHEFRLTPDGTALILSYRDEPYDLTPVGGPKDGHVLDYVVQEIDIATGEKVMDWHSLDHIPITDSDRRADPGATTPFPYMHLNAVGLDHDGDLLLSGRETSTIYKVDRETGEVVWRLGGKRSDFRLGAGARTIGQHNIEPAGEDTYRVFDNQNMGSPGYESRVAWLRIDERRMTAELVRQQVHPDRLTTGVEGSSQALPNGNTFVSWGSPSGRISEFSPSGRLVFDGALPKDISSYRGYRAPWKSTPDTAPDAEVNDTVTAVGAVWNGATEVEDWRVLGGEKESALRPVARAEWKGLDTEVRLPPDARDIDYVQVQALDARGRVIGSSPVEAVETAETAEAARPGRH
ncbi:arylsulfotransferase family protein [Streptomyces sp. B5E4]|uniref:arylsulfotransferase family protein n=1 Tax=Streptomyces sp. B5E4 TaxID=3153568 RepID=UPI00325C475E